MKKLKYISLMVIMMLIAALAINNVNADENFTQGFAENSLTTTFSIYHVWGNDDNLQLFYYPGDTIEMEIGFEDLYYLSYENDKKITDFDIQMSGGDQGKGGAGLVLTPVLNGANWSDKTGSLYFIQQLATADKLTFVGGETIAKYTEKIDMDYFASLPELSDEEYTATLEILKNNFRKISGKYYFNDSSMMSFENDPIEFNIVPYVAGDYNLDHEIDFFDVTQLISSVYDTDMENLDWRNREAVTTNTKAYTTDETYNHRTAELGFTDIIYLIKTVYD